ncbi:hypothetical protein CsSME_00035908 [Camellia sinensis var. sinensis]
MAKCCYVTVMFVLAIVLVLQANARTVPGDTNGVNHEQTNVLNMSNAMAPSGKGVKDKKYGVAFASVGGAVGVGGVLLIGGIEGIGGVGGIGGASGLGGLRGRGGGVGGGGGGVGGIIP